MRRIDWHNTIQIDPEFRQEHGVVFACPFRERGGVTVRDYSGNRYHGTLTNGPTRAFDKWGGPAIFLDGTDDHVNFGNGSHLTRWTVACWAKCVDFTDFNILVVRASSTERNYELRTNLTSGTVTAVMTNGPSSYVEATSTGAVTAGEWAFLAATYDGAAMRIYINGQPDGSLSTSITPSDINGLRVGTFTDGGNYAYATIAHPLVCSKAATAEQILRLYRDPYAQYWQPSRKRTFVIDAGTPAASRLLNLRRRCYA